MRPGGNIIPFSGDPAAPFSSPRHHRSGGKILPFSPSEPVPYPSQNLIDSNRGGYRVPDEDDRILLDKLEALTNNGIFKAPRAVKINRQVDLRTIKATPFMRFLLSFLQVMDENGGRLPLDRTTGIGMEEERFFFLVNQGPFNTLEPRDEGETGRYRNIITYTQMISTETGLTKDGTDEVVLTDRGREILEGKKIGSCYFRGLRFFTEQLVWIYKTGLPPCLDEYQLASGFFLFVIAAMGKPGMIVEGEHIVQAANQVMPFLEMFEEKGVGFDLAVAAFDQIFLWNYCFLMGFLIPMTHEEIEEEGLPPVSWYDTTPLFYDIFQWQDMPYL